MYYSKVCYNSRTSIWNIKKNFRGLRPWTPRKGKEGQGREERGGEGRQGRGREGRGREWRDKEGRRGDSTGG
jgi:hypothetical protein